MCFVISDSNKIYLKKLNYLFFYFKKKVKIGYFSKIGHIFMAELLWDMVVVLKKIIAILIFTEE
jgi:hypothetical protein